ncbi:MAG: hypothetical protein RL497_2729 [Pseudomonadota bacterium]
MSLINDVLQQLDARVPVAQPERVYVESAGGINPGIKIFFISPWVKVGFLALFGFSCGYGAVSIHRALTINSSSAGVELLGAQEARPAYWGDLLSAGTALNIGTTLSDGTTLGVGTTLSVGTVGDITLPETLKPLEMEEPQGEHEATLLLAKRLFLADRLTYPPMNNAYQLYREILLKDASHEMALNGIAAIKQRYVVLAEEAIALRESAKAQRYIERAEFVGVDAAALELLRVSLLAFKSSENNILYEDAIANEYRIVGEAETEHKYVDPKKNNIQNGYEKINNHVVAGAARQDSSLTLQPNEQAVTLGGAVDDFSAQNETGVSLLSGNKKNTEKDFIAALGAARDGEAMAFNYVRTHADANDTVRWLAKKWVGIQAWQKLLDLMNMPSALPATERGVYRAQGLLGLKKYEDIIVWLGQGNNLDQPELMRILAVAWQQTGREDQAFVIYNQLVARHPENSGLWLAFGISADALGNKTAAQEAFFRARQLGGHSKAVNDFIDGKLKVAGR